MPAITLSSGFTDALRFGGQLVNARFTVYSQGNPTTFTLPTSTCSVTVTRYSAQRRQGNITCIVEPTIPPPAILPTNPSSLLAPFGNEVFIELGISPAGKLTTTTWVPLGLLVIATTVVSDLVNDLTVSLELYDRSWVIAQRKLKTPWNFPAVTGNFVAEMVHLLNTVWGTTKPALRYNIQPTTAKVPKASFNQNSDPWTAAMQMANAVGYELFFNATGVVTGYPIPTPSTQPVLWNFVDTPTYVYGSGTGSGSTALEGSPYSSPAEVSVQMTRDGIYNDVLVTGTGSYNATGAGSTGSTAPVLGEAKTTTPQSSTYATGQLGDIPEFVSSNLVTSDAQALAAAQNYLKASLADAFQVTIKQPPTGWLDIDDCVRVSRPRVGLNTVKMIVDSLTFTTSYSDLESITGRVVPG